ncbi:MAG: AAA family ATPase [Bacillota bacterium]
MSNSHVIVLHGPAGGVGKSLIALHLAYLYASKGLSTVLVDLAQYGAIAPWLQIPRGTSAGLAGMLTALEQGGVADGRIRSTLVPAPGMKENLQLVLSSGPAKMDRIQSPEVEALLGHLSGIAQVVVVDTGNELSARLLGAFLAATKIAITVQPAVIAGWQTIELLDLMRSAYVSRDKLGVIFNRVQPGGRYGLEEFEQAIGLPTLGRIPEAAGLRRAPEQGGPPAIHRNTPGVRAIRQVAHQLIPVFAAKELRRSWL